VLAQFDIPRHFPERITMSYALPDPNGWSLEYSAEIKDRTRNDCLYAIQTFSPHSDRAVRFLSLLASMSPATFRQAAIAWYAANPPVAVKAKESARVAQEEESVPLGGQEVKDAE
jgi:aryl-alcohol dehydrogenase-like predicted oxidoreductase